jgi:hypothetical protein
MPIPASLPRYATFERVILAWFIHKPATTLFDDCERNLACTKTAEAPNCRHLAIVPTSRYALWR